MKLYWYLVDLPQLHRYLLCRLTIITSSRIRKRLFEFMCFFYSGCLFLSRHSRHTTSEQRYCDVTLAFLRRINVHNIRARQVVSVKNVRTSIKYCSNRHQISILWYTTNDLNILTPISIH